MDPVTRELAVPVFDVEDGKEYIVGHWDQTVYVCPEHGTEVIPLTIIFDTAEFCDECREAESALRPANPGAEWTRLDQYWEDVQEKERVL